MASNSLGTLTLDLVAKIGAFTGPLDKASQDARKRNAEIAKSFDDLAKGVGVAIGAIPAALTALVVHSASVAKEISNQAALAGLGTTEFQKYAAGAKSVGIEQDKLADIFKDTNDKLGDFANTGGGALKDFFTNIAPKVGVTADSFKKLNSKDALALYVTSLEKANVNQQEMTFYMEAIANDSTALVPLLRNGGKAFDELGAAAEAAGVVMDEGTIAAAKQFGVEVQGLQQYLGSAQTMLAAQFLPVLAQFSKDVNGAAKDAGGLKGVVGDLGQSLVTTTAFVVNAGDGVVRVFDIAAQTIVGMYSTAVAHMGSLMSSLATGMSKITFGDMSKGFAADSARLRDEASTNFGVAAQAAAAISDNLNKPLAGQRFEEYVAQAKKAAAELAKTNLSVTNGSGSGVDPAAIAAKAAAAKKAASDAAAAVKKLNDTFDSTGTDLERQISLINTSVDARKNATEVAKVQFEIESGKLAGINAEQQKHLLGLAAELDAKKKLKQANEDDAKSATYAATLKAANVTAQAGFDQDLAGAGQGSKARARMQELLQIRQEYNDKAADLQTQLNAGDISQNLYDKETGQLQSALDERLSLQQNYYDQLDDAQSNWLDGAKNAWQDYSDSAKDMSSQMYDVTSNALSSLEDELVNFAKTGKFNFSDFATGIADDLLHMLVKVGLQMAVNAAIGDTAAAGSAALAAATGTAMAAAYAPAAAMASLASFGANAAPASAAITSTTALASSLSLLGMAHDGIDAIPETGTWLLQKGERVTTAGTSAKLDKTLSDIQAGSSGQGGSSGTPAIQQQITVQGAADEATLARIQEAAKQGAQLGYQMVLKDFSTNGPARRQLRRG